MLEFSSIENRLGGGVGALTEARQISTYQLLGQSHLGLDLAWRPENEMLRVSEHIV